jgi:HSP20 family protein
MANIVKQELKFPTFKNLIESFFESDFPLMGNQLSKFIGSTIPSANIKETNENFQIELAVPGLKKEDIKIDLDQDVLTISSEQKEEKTEEKEKDNYTRREFNYSSFSRSFYLPEIADTDKISAEYKDGVLNILIPKKESAIKKPQKRIEIK